MLRIIKRKGIKFPQISSVRFNSTDGVQLQSLHLLSEEEQLFKDSVSKFSNEIIKPKVSSMDESELLDPILLTQLFEQGLMGLETPEEYGGSGASFMAFVQTIEELAKIDPAIATTVDVHSLVTNMFNSYATPAQKEKYLNRLTLDTLGSFCLSEASSGSDAFSLKMRADKDGDSYILNGSKMWITNSYEAGIFLVFANVDHSKGYKGITCFIVEKEMGVKVAKKEKKLGIRCSSTCVLDFDNVKVPEENILGEVGKGYKYAISLLNEGRIGIGAQMVGLAQGAFDAAVPYTFQRKQFGKAIGDNQVLFY
jgi:alkylation response protein AidB-like acyl-CoA dehydrogenase